MVNFNTQYANINYLNNNTSSKKVVSESDDAYFDFIIEKFFTEETKEKLGYKGSPNVKEVENSLYKRYMEDKLSKDEKEILNRFGTDYLVEGVDLITLKRRKIDLLKTLTSMSEFEKIWGAERAQREKLFFDQLRARPLTQEDTDRFLANKNEQNENKKPFKPIQGESKNKETYKDDNIRNELVKKLLEGKFSESKELELLLGIKFSSDDIGEFNKILSQITTPKSIDIRA
ncbi:TPA: hypothetical protein RTH13_000836 [Campylobacter jejuni]|nr:hypothetical protein [Campylobacter jejuni]HDZ5090367.1 hypothetical protein [Campylobacter jejuni]HDZ5091971.1 hypothetical protein [Campylobacter jejuni]HDZ5100189.1 hypothetical protein [Campylobacter jejuni]HDZ5107660.1 hypothetical protein [Campylobacter jejuni]